jgi:hypothetical protein
MQDFPKSTTPVKNEKTFPDKIPEPGYKIKSFPEKLPEPGYKMEIDWYYSFMIPFFHIMLITNFSSCEKPLYTFMYGKKNCLHLKLLKKDCLNLYHLLTSFINILPSFFDGFSPNTN